MSSSGPISFCYFAYSVLLLLSENDTRGHPKLHCPCSTFPLPRKLKPHRKSTVEPPALRHRNHKAAHIFPCHFDQVLSSIQIASIQQHVFLFSPEEHALYISMQHPSASFILLCNQVDQLSLRRIFTLLCSLRTYLQCLIQ